MYNEYVVGYVVTDKITGRFVNFQFKNNGDLDYGFILKLIRHLKKKKQLSIGYAHHDVDALEDIYAAAMELQRRVRLSKLSTS